MQAIIEQIAAFLEPLIANNWSFFVGVVVALFAGKFLKAGWDFLTSILVLCIGIAVLTNMGVLPPLDELLDIAAAMLGELLQGVQHLVPSLFS